MNLAIDVGNTRTKLAVFQNKELLEVRTIAKENLLSDVAIIKEDFPIEQAVLSSVASISKKMQSRLGQLVDTYTVTHESIVPFKNRYASPTTLGIDRIALMAAASCLYKKTPTLVIDAGTCITYDFLSATNEYLGGAISPGVQMRYQSLHKFTARLPLLDAQMPDNFTGNDTKSSIHSGVTNGIIQEIQGVIHQYEHRHGHLTIVLTGGDSIFLSKQLKSTIFANQNFLLIGLNEILILNRNL